MKGSNLGKQALTTFKELSCTLACGSSNFSTSFSRICLKTSSEGIFAWLIAPLKAFSMFLMLSMRSFHAWLPSCYLTVDFVQDVSEVSWNRHRGCRFGDFSKFARRLLGLNFFLFRIGQLVD